MSAGPITTALKCNDLVGLAFKVLWHPAIFPPTFLGGGGRIRARRDGDSQFEEVEVIAMLGAAVSFTISVKMFWLVFVGIALMLGVPLSLYFLFRRPPH